MSHTFAGGRAVEARYAPLLDDWLRSHGYDLRPASRDEEWRGIDRVVTAENGEPCHVEYKVDEVAKRTGRLFIETVSNDTSGRAGWAYTTEARWLFYLVVGERLYCIRPERMRALLPVWLDRYPLRRANNGDFGTIGVCVPFAAAEAAAEQVVRFAALEQRCPP